MRNKSYTRYFKKGLKKIEVSVSSGTEGPAYDPYSYDEYSFKIKRLFQKEKEIVVHLGLRESIEVNGMELNIFTGGEPYDNLANLFKEEVGITLNQFLSRIDRTYRKRISKCPKCKSKKLEWESGFPGESLLICQKCGAIVDSTILKIYL